MIYTDRTADDPFLINPKQTTFYTKGLPIQEQASNTPHTTRSLHKRLSSMNRSNERSIDLNTQQIWNNAAQTHRGKKKVKNHRKIRDNQIMSMDITIGIDRQHLNRKNKRSNRKRRSNSKYQNNVMALNSNEPI